MLKNKKRFDWEKPPLSYPTPDLRYGLKIHSLEVSLLFFTEVPLSYRVYAFRTINILNSHPRPYNIS